MLFGSFEHVLCLLSIRDSVVLFYMIVRCCVVGCWLHWLVGVCHPLHLVLFWGVAILRASYAAQKPTIPKIRKMLHKYKSPTPGLPPKNTRKIPEKYYLGHFCIFFFLAFSGPIWVGVFVFFVFLRIFEILGCFWSL